MEIVERNLNRDLRKVDASYAVSNLTALPSGDYWFDLVVAFKPRDIAKINRIFSEHLGKPPKAARL